MRNLFFTIVATLLCIPAIGLAAITTTDTGVHATGGIVYGSAPPSVGDFIGSNIINPLFGISGTIFFALFVYGGLLWMTAAGRTEQVEKAKKLLINSVLGLVIIFSAYAITLFLFNNLM